MFDSLFAQPLSVSSLVYLFVWSPLYATHDHTIAAYFAVVPRLYHPFLICLPALYLGLYFFALTSHVCLDILISARSSATSFYFLIGQVSLPCSILLHTQLLYSLPQLINYISVLVSNGTDCRNLFHLIRILASTAASASPSTLNMSPN